MIIKKMRGSGFRGVLAYVLADKDTESPAELIGGNMAGETVGELSREFGQLRQLNPKAKRAVRHFAIRLHPKDKALSEEQWVELANDFCDRFGYDSYRAFVLHRDSRPPHLHIVTSQIAFNGKLAREYKDFHRIKAYCRAKEVELGLGKVSSKPTGASKLFHPRRRGNCRLDAGTRQKQFETVLAEVRQPRTVPAMAVRKDRMHEKAQEFIAGVIQQARTSSRYMELLATEGTILGRINDIKARLIKAQGTPQEQDLALQLADLEKEMAANLIAKLQAMNLEAEREAEERQQHKRRLKL